MKALPFIFIALLPHYGFSIEGVKSEKVLIIGDSLTEGYGVAKDKAYPSLLEKQIQKLKPHYKVVNAGSSGSTSASAATRLNWHLKSKPKILILALGANDGLRGFPVEGTKKNLGEAVDKAKAAGITVYLAGMMVPTNYGKEYSQKFKNIFPELAKEKKVKLIPFLLKDVGGRPELNQADGIHPNEKGHEIMAKTVYQSIQEDL